MNIEERFEYYHSQMNGNKDDVCQTIESIGTFAHKSFSEQIKHNIEYYGMTIESLSKSINISEFRLSCLLNKNAEFEPREIELIRKRLHI